MAPKVVTDDQLTTSLELVISQGLNVSEAAAKLGVSKTALTQRLRKLPRYQEYRELHKAKKEKVLAMGRTGYTATIIAQELGLKLTATRSWLLEAGINTAKLGDDDLTRPACNGVMRKQDMFFWLCSKCCPEWWPKEAPDNPDDWVRPWRIRYEDGGKEMLGITWE